MITPRTKTQSDWWAAYVKQGFSIEFIFILTNTWFQYLFTLANFDIVLSALIHDRSLYLRSSTRLALYSIILVLLLSLAMIFLLVKILQKNLAEKGIIVKDHIAQTILCVLEVIAWTVIIGEVWFFRNYVMHLLGANIFAVILNPKMFCYTFKIYTQDIFKFFIFLVSSFVIQVILLNTIEYLQLKFQLCTDYTLMRVSGYFHIFVFVLAIILYFYSGLSFATIFLRSMGAS